MSVYREDHPLDGSIIYRGMTEEDWRRLHDRVLPNPLGLAEFKAAVTGEKAHCHYLAKDLHKIAQEMRDILKEHGELREAASFPLHGKKSELGKALSAAVDLVDSARVARGGGARAGTASPTAMTTSSFATATITSSSGEAGGAGRGSTEHTGPLPHRRAGTSAPSSPLETTTLATSGNGSATAAASGQQLTEAAPPQRFQDSPTVDPSSEEERGGSRTGTASNEAKAAADSLTAGASLQPLAPLASSSFSSSFPSSSLPLPAHGKPTRTPPIVDHILEGSTGPDGDLEQQPTTGASPPPATSSSAATATDSWSSRPGRAGQRAWAPPVELGRRVAANAATIGPTAAPTVRGSSGAVADKVHALASSAASSLEFATAAAPAVPIGPTPPPPLPPMSTGVRNELITLNERCPPFFQILSVVRRFQLRYGTHPMKFEIPIQYAQAVSTRRLRVQLVPLRHPNNPSRWPVAREIVVYVNDQCVTTPWRRTWPERKEEVAKTYLPLDITQLLNRTLPSQRLQIDLFNKEYFTPALLVVVQPFSLEEVVEAMLEREIGEGQVARSEASLLGRCPPKPRLLENVAAVARFYQRVMEDEVEEGLEVDDPIVTTKCPISQMPIVIPVRGRQCSHLQCVDLQSYLVSCHKGAYWNCALCDRELRPNAVMIDTVLWRYLLHHQQQEQQEQQGGGATLQYLRLSIRHAAAQAKEEANSEGSDVATLARYYWHPSRGTHGEADYLVDDDDEEEPQHEGEGRNSHSDSSGNRPPNGTCGPAETRRESTTDYPGDDEQAVARAEQHQQQQQHHLYGGSLSSAKRARSPSPEAAVPEGSYENPIEL